MLAAGNDEDEDDDEDDEDDADAMAAAAAADEAAFADGKRVMTDEVNEVDADAARDADFDENGDDDEEADEDGDDVAVMMMSWPAARAAADMDDDDDDDDEEEDEDDAAVEPVAVGTVEWRIENELGTSRSSGGCCVLKVYCTSEVCGQRS